MKVLLYFMLCRKKKSDDDLIKDIVDKQEMKFFDFNHVGKNTTNLPEIRDLKGMCGEAQLFRDHVRDSCSKEVCSICSMLVQQNQFNNESDSEGFMPISSVPNLHVLQVGLEPTAECPRDSLTTYAYDLIVCNR